MKKDQPELYESIEQDAEQHDPDIQRREALRLLTKWSKAVVGAMLLGGSFPENARAQLWLKTPDVWIKPPWNKWGKESVDEMFRVGTRAWKNVQRGKVMDALRDVGRIAPAVRYATDFTDRMASKLTRMTGGTWVTDRGKVRRRIEGRGRSKWKVAWGREIHSKDYFRGAVAAFTGPATFSAWIWDLVRQSIRELRRSVRRAAKGFTRSMEREAVAMAQRVIAGLIRGKRPGMDEMRIGRFDFKAGVAQYTGHNMVAGHRIPPAMVSYEPFVAIRYRR